LALTRLDSKTLHLDELSGWLMDAPIEGKGKLTFYEGEENPYFLDANFAMTGLALGKLLDMVNMGRFFEGSLDITIETDMEAPNLDVLARTLQGEVAVRSGAGVIDFIGLGGQSVLEYIDRLDKLLRLADGGRNFIPFLRDKGPSEEDLQKAQAVMDILLLLRGFHFEEITLEARRGKDLRVEMPVILFRSEGLLITGKGFFTVNEAFAVADQPMDIEIEMWVADNTKDLFERAKLVKTTVQNGDGYFQGPKIHLRGTPASPDLTSFIAAFLTPVLPY
jgi:hypothetical protein